MYGLRGRKAFSISAGCALTGRRDATANATNSSCVTQASSRALRLRVKSWIQRADVPKRSSIRTHSTRGRRPPSRASSFGCVRNRRVKNASRDVALDAAPTLAGGFTGPIGRDRDKKERMGSVTVLLPSVEPELESNRAEDMPQDSQRGATGHARAPARPKRVVPGIEKNRKKTRWRGESQKPRVGQTRRHGRRPLGRGESPGAIAIGAHICGALSLHAKNVIGADMLAYPRAFPGACGAFACESSEAKAWV